MTQIFAPSLLENYDLYHLKYGRGAVIVAIRDGSDGASPREQISSDKRVARLFNAQIPDDVKKPQPSILYCHLKRKTVSSG